MVQQPCDIIVIDVQFFSSMKHRNGGGRFADPSHMNTVYVLPLARPSRERRRCDAFRNIWNQKYKIIQSHRMINRFLFLSNIYIILGCAGLTEETTTVWSSEHVATSETSALMGAGRIVRTAREWAPISNVGADFGDDESRWSMCPETVPTMRL